MIEKIITGTLRALTGIHVGSGETRETTDSPVFRNADNDILIPGTTISGALRALATKIAPSLGLDKCSVLEKSASDDYCDCHVCNLFGSIISGEDSENALASKIWIYDAILKNSIKPSIRDGTGIDRETKTSARVSRAKYDLEVVPKDSEFIFQIELRGDITDENENLLAAILSEWKCERCYLGGNLARGLGNMKLDDIEVYTFDLSTPENLISFLKEENLIKVGNNDEKWLEDHTEKARVMKESDKNVKKVIIIDDDNDVYYRSFAQMDFTLQFTGGFIISEISSAVRTGYDFSPYMEYGKFVLPGSSLRGVFRSHAEKIARTLTTFDCAERKDFLIMCPACDPHADNNASLASCNSLLRKYRKERQILPDEEVQDKQLCLACQLFGSSYKGTRFYVGDGAVNSFNIKIMDFLAIDRFTGGGKEGAKFNALILWKPDFKVRIFFENPREWDMGWLMLVFKDIRDGLLSVGSGKNKCFGNVKLTDESIKFGFISDDFLLNGLNINISDSFEGVFRTATWNFEELVNEPEKPVELWIQEFHTKVKKFRREYGLRPSSDSFFNGTTNKLYPKGVKI